MVWDHCSYFHSKFLANSVLWSVFDPPPPPHHPPSSHQPTFTLRYAHPEISAHLKKSAQRPQKPALMDF